MHEYREYKEVRNRVSILVPEIYNKEHLKKAAHCIKVEYGVKYDLEELETMLEQVGRSEK